MSLKAWRYPIAEVMVAGTATPLGGPSRPVGWAWRPVELVDYFPCDEPIVNLFTFGASDYDMSDDEMYCPCGDTLPARATLGERREDALEHVRSKHAGTVKLRGNR